MLQGIERLVSVVEPRSQALNAATLDEVCDAVHAGDVTRLRATDGHFAAVSRDGQTVRLARTIGLPLRYFVAKMFHGPFLVVADRMDTLFNWCVEQKIGWQFDPLYTRMVPAHYLIEIDQIGCPDPAPRYRRFFDPLIAHGSLNVVEAGARYTNAAYQAIERWLSEIPADEPVGIAFSGGVDSVSVLLLARKALADLGRNPDQARAFTLDLGGGKDAEQAESVVRELGIAHCWEVVRRDSSAYDLEEAIRVIEDYHPLDVECAAAGLALLGGVRERYPTLRYMLDGDGGDENLKSYPLEDSDLTLSSVLRNPLLYQEGWGVDAIKHSLTYTGGLSRSYARSFAPAQRYEFDAFSPYTTRSAIAEALAIPFERLLGGSAERLYSLKADLVKSGVRAITGIDMPAHPKRRFQDGVGGDSYRRWRVSKAWCRQVFLRQWEDRLRAAWDPEGERISGNDLTPAIPLGR